ncbi:MULTISPECIES: TolC family protein [Sporosarcina]|uniref:TolC family protein n=1 Tax=Sporosarcina TaxID=1569 RepID=UPI0002FB5E23|nr:TolC family protein [Sporosarcina newyorkensis]MBY0221638.1 TolC family protein [Sporosarcina aquimarina]
MNKKGTALGLAFLLAFPGMSTVALADGVEEVEKDGELIEDVDNIEEDDVILEGDAEDEDSEDMELELLESLSLDTVLELALEDNYSLLLSNYQLELLKIQTGGTDSDYGETAFDIKDLERTKKRLQKASGSGSFAERLQIQNQLEALQDKIDAVEAALEQMESQQVSLIYTEEEAKENIKMAATASYVKLLMTAEQQELQKKALEVKEKEVAIKKRQYDLGILSRDEHSKELREIERQETQLALDKKDWDQELAEFTFDLGVVYHPELKLEPLDLDELELVEQQTETQELIENTFKYKSQVTAIELAEKQRTRVYDDEDSKTHDKNEADLKVKIEKEKLEQLKTNGAVTIRQLFYDVEDGFQDIRDAERELKFAKEDDKTLKRRYELGLVSRADYELAGIRVDQAQLKLDLAKESYFLLTKNVELLEAGVI